MLINTHKHSAYPSVLISWFPLQSSFVLLNKSLKEEWTATWSDCETLHYAVMLYSSSAVFRET